MTPLPASLGDPAVSERLGCAHGWVIRTDPQGCRVTPRSSTTPARVLGTKGLGSRRAGWAGLRMPVSGSL